MPRPAILALTSGLLLVALAYALTLVDRAAGLAPWFLALGASAVLGALLAIAVRGRRGRRRILLVTAALTSLTLAVGLGAALAAPPSAPDGPLLLGLPRTTALLLLLVGLVPLVALPLAYAVAFDREVMDDGND